MFERFTQSARTIVVEAQATARRLQHRRIDTEHLLLALLQHGDGAAALLREAGITAPDVQAAIVRHHRDAPGTLGAQDAAALRTIGIDLAAIRDRLEQTFGADALTPPADEPRRWFGLRRGRTASGERAAGHLPFAPRAKRVLELSLREAVRLRNRQIAAEHLLLGLIRENGGLGARILADSGADLTALRERIEATLRAPAA
ncbi:Clp protease N-terminal domain-containing protein [Plantactinospora sp. KBS50]|uniref:Clp protease N-terminal domain-containing protein n=1 Tax=Plantactinospora sp. KBS50 TaxID=2024580 RepID=UPI000BAACAC3|nr:Clp protease N-terminal domain-containing protein [Plantactinospora sp. KBS50]ASW53589.1 hypothetical protein CIK06_04395 [Plantactinospora sp. KBS50]